MTNEEWKRAVVEMNQVPVGSDTLKAITFAIEWISLYEDVEGWFPSASYRDELAKNIYKAFKESK